MVSQALLVGAIVLGQAAGDDIWKRFESPARQLIQDLSAGRYQQVESRFTPRMKHAVSAAALAGVMEPTRARYGAFQRIVSHRHLADQPQPTFEIVLQFSKLDDLLQLNVTFDDDNRIAGLRLLPAPATARSDGKRRDRFANYKTRTKLLLPFRGRWTVANGGRTRKQNHHVNNRNQRYAYDFHITGVNQRSYRTDGQTNEDFFAYGQPVLAPGAGKVVQVVDGVKDNQPGQTNPYFVPGNLVVIDHGNDEYSFLAHFIPGSIVVQVGDPVRAGQRLGRCGNSGNSSEPHIHYHLANAATMHQGDGLPALFRQALVNGEPTTNSEPVRGDLISNRE